jgi:uncharacterized protein (TIGR03435 family)
MTAEQISSALTGMGSAFANHLWQSTAFAAIVGLLTMLLRKHQARIRFSLWLAASIKFLLPFSLLIALGGLLPKPQHIVTSAQTGFYTAIDFAGQPFSVGSVPPIQSTAHAESLLQRLTPQLPLVFAAIWIFGAFVVLLVRFLSWRQVSATLRRASPVQQGREIRLLRRLEETAGRQRKIALRLSPDRMEPAVFGIFRPVLIWPERLSERLDEEQMEAILAHEMTHLQRHDNLAAAIHMLVEVLFWFHPMVWWMERRMIDERERACDEAVVRLGRSPEAYAEGLLKACRFCVEAPLACVSGITGADLARRVRAIMALPLGRHLGLKEKLLLALAAAMAIAGPVTFGVVRAAQTPSTQSTAKPDSQTAAGDITGNWQGTLKDVRVILVIAKDNGVLKGTLYYNIDHPGQPIKASSGVFLDGSTFKFDNEIYNATYEGKLSADGNTITGTWRAGPEPLSFVFVRANKTTAWEIPASPPPPKLMPADADPSVEVATIKPNDSGIASTRRLGWNGHFYATNFSLEELIVFSYNVNSKQIVGGPSWMRSDRYDIVIVPDVGGQPTLDQIRSMVRKLLTDRFQLKFHKETREMSALVLTVDKGGAKINHTQFNDPRPHYGWGAGKGGLNLGMENGTIPDFIGYLEWGGVGLDRPMVDHTALQGRFDFNINFMPDETQFNGHSPIGKLPDDVEPAPSLSEAMRQQLGLKISSEKTAVDVIAIDHVEKPSPN